MTPAPYLAFDGDDSDIVFFSGNAYSDRTQRYVRLEHGNEVDYWLGVDSVYLINDVCTMIENNPKMWLIIDQSRLYSAQSFGGNLAAVVSGLMYVAYIGPGDVIVFRPSPAPSHQVLAEQICAKAASLQAQGINELTWPTPPLSFR